MNARMMLGWAAGWLCGAGAVFAQGGASVDKFRAEAEAEVATAYTVVFDTSGSMKGPRLTQAKQAFRWWLASVQPGNVWSVLNFDNGKGRVVVPFTPAGQGKVAEAIERFNADSNTPIVATLTVAEKQIMERKATKPYERHVLLLFTDGEENIHPGRTGAVVEKIRALRRQNVEVIGVGYAGAGDYMAGVASRYFSANDEPALRTGLAQVEVEVDPLTPVSVTAEEMKKLAQPFAAGSAPTAAPARVDPAPPAPKKAVGPAPKPKPAKSSGFGFGSVSMIVGLAFLALVIAIIKKFG